MLFQNNRPVSNLKFTSYEKCRQWARRLVRRSDKFDILRLFDESDYKWRTPSLSMHNYEVRKI